MSLIYQKGEKTGERRKNLRSNVHIWAKERREDSIYFHLLSNLSSGGLFIEKKLPFPVGSILNLELTLVNPEDKIDLKGVIIDNYKDLNSNYRGAGVKIIEMEEKDKERIQNYLEKLNK